VRGPNDLTERETKDKQGATIAALRGCAAKVMLGRQSPSLERPLPTTSRQKLLWRLARNSRRNIRSQRSWKLLLPDVLDPNIAQVRATILGHRR
jgi:hypothetical protein